MKRRALQILLTVCVIGVALLSATVRADVAPTSAPAAGRAGTKAVVISIRGRIDDTTSRFVTRKLEEARALGADTAILELDTPGGLATAGLEISQTLKQQTQIHTIAYVQQMALSAGTMIAIACDEIVMQPGSMIGDSAPISVSDRGELQTLGATERAKAESPILADFRDSALRNGYSPLLAESMVTVGRVVRWVEKENEPRRFVNEENFRRLIAEGWKEVSDPGVPQPVDASDTLLTVHADLAAKLGLAKGVFLDVESFASDRGLQIVQVYKPRGGDQVLELMAKPVARFLVLVVFLVALYAAVHAPGHGVAELIALVSLGLLVTVPLLTGYAQWWEVVMIVVGLVLLALELFVIPGFGITGISGILLIVAGLVLTFVGNTGLPGTWQNGSVWAGVQTGLIVVVGALASSIVLFMWIRSYLPKMPYMNRLILAPVGASDANPAGVSGTGVEADAWPFRGTVGKALSELKPGGTAQFPYGDDHRATSVVADGAFVPAGAKIVVREVRGNRVVVHAV